VLRVRLARVQDIVAGELRGFRVAGMTWPVLATRLEGDIVVTAGVCPHEDVSLVDGDLRGSRVVCPGHGYEFDLGTGRCQHDDELQLRRYRVTVVDDEVWIDVL
jgi:toluene monooxygenase system ferredoxin subunit